MAGYPLDLQVTKKNIAAFLQHITASFKLSFVGIMIFQLNDLLAILLSLSCSCCCSCFLCSSDSTNCAAVLILKREIFNCQSKIHHHFFALRSQNNFHIICNSCQELKNQINKKMNLPGVSPVFFFFPSHENYLSPLI